MSGVTFRATAAIVLALAAPAAFAQSVISARSGLVHYTEGNVAIDGEPLAMQFGRFPILQNGESFSTETGYAEILLAPGSFLRLGPDTTVKMVSNEIDATRVEVTKGMAMVEVTQIAKGAIISVDVCGEQTVIAKRGLYEFDADLSRVRVYDGKLAGDVLGDKEMGKGRMVSFDGDPDVEKFKTKDRSHLYFWSQNRSMYLASANLGTASSARKGFITTNSWVWNSYLNTFTFIPVSGTSRSPFGWYWYSQPTVWIVSAPVTSSGWGGSSPDSWSGIQSRSASSGGSSGGDGGAVRSAAPASAPAVSVSSGSGGSTGGGRSR